MENSTHVLEAPYHSDYYLWTIHGTELAIEIKTPRTALVYDLWQELAMNGDLATMAAILDISQTKPYTYLRKTVRGVSSDPSIMFCSAVVVG